MRSVTEQELNDADVFASAITFCFGAVFFVGVFAVFFS